MMKVTNTAVVLFSAKVAAIQISSFGGVRVNSFNTDVVDVSDEQALKTDPPKYTNNVAAVIANLSNEDAQDEVIQMPDMGTVIEHANAVDQINQEQKYTTVLDTKTTIPVTTTVRPQEEVNTETFKKFESVFEYQKRNRYGNRENDDEWYSFRYINERGEDVTRAMHDRELRLRKKDNAHWLYSTDIEKLQSDAIYTRGKASSKPVYLFRSDGEERTCQKYTDLYRRKTYLIRAPRPSNITLVQWKYQVWNGDEQTWDPILDLTNLANKDPNEANNIPINHQKWSYSTKLDNLLSNNTYSKSLWVKSAAVGRRVSEWRMDGTPRNTKKPSDRFRMSVEIVHEGSIKENDFYNSDDDYPMETVDLYKSLPSEHHHLLSQVGDWFEPCNENSSLADGAPSHLVEKFKKQWKRSKCVKMDLPEEAAFLEKFKGQPIWDDEKSEFSTNIDFDVTEERQRVKFLQNKRRVPCGTFGIVKERRANGDVEVQFEDPAKIIRLGNDKLSFQPTTEMQIQMNDLFQEKRDGTVILKEKFFHLLKPQDSFTCSDSNIPPWDYIITSVNGEDSNIWNGLHDALLKTGDETVEIQSSEIRDFPENRDLGMFLDKDGTLLEVHEKKWADLTEKTFKKFARGKGYRFRKVNSHVVQNRDDFDAVIAECSPGDEMSFELTGQASIQLGLKPKKKTAVVPKDFVHSELELLKGARRIPKESYPTLSFIKAAHQSQAVGSDEVRITFQIENDIENNRLSDFDNLKEVLQAMQAKDIRTIRGSAENKPVDVVCTIKKDQLGINHFHH